MPLLSLPVTLTIIICVMVKLYRNEHNMIRQALGEEIEYQD